MEGFQTVLRGLHGPRLGLIGSVLALGLVAGTDAARAQGKLDARYVVTLAGVQLGKGAWIIDIGETEYTAAASGLTTGLLRVFASGQGQGAARGYVQNGQLIPSTYASNIVADKKTEDLRITLGGGNVKEYFVDPPTEPHPDRIPLTDAHRHGVVDPMSGSLGRVAGTGDTMSPEACNRTVSVFDGRIRYDLKLAFKRMETVKTDHGYAGPVAVCAVFFRPIAGYIPDRAAIKYLIAQRDMEVWVAPIAGTRIVVPYRLTIPTPIGLGVLQATQFITTAQPHASAASVRTQ